MGIRVLAAVAVSLVAIQSIAYIARNQPDESDLPVVVAQCSCSPVGDLVFVNIKDGVARCDRCNAIVEPPRR